VQLCRYFVSQSSEFCRHNPLCCCFSTSVYCFCLFHYRLSPETFGYTFVQLTTRLRTDAKILFTTSSGVQWGGVIIYTIRWLVSSRWRDGNNAATRSVLTGVTTGLELEAHTASFHIGTWHPKACYTIKVKLPLCSATPLRRIGEWRYSFTHS
jgi:hypothetical protein